MPRVGVALGGGGPVGIAWEIGVLHGLVEAGFDLDDVTTIVGTSAGSVVGAHLANGADLGELVADQQVEAELPGLEASDHTAPQAPDMTRVIEIFSLLRGPGPMTEERAREAAQLALNSPTPPESNWVASFERLLGDRDWGSIDLLLTSVNCSTGARTVWTSQDGVPLALVVASSCAVPGMFPPVSIGDSRFTDGGLWSTSNADLLAGHGADRAIFIGPIGAGGRRSPALEREQAVLAAEGTELAVVLPGTAFQERIGVNLMDRRLRGVAAEIGVADGQAAASRVL
jgi:NTE family protein